MMNRAVYAGAVAAGLAVVGWVGWGFVGSNALALAITGLIAGVFLLGAAEILRFRQATAVLARVLAQVPPGLTALDGWLAGLPAALQAPVRARIEGERAALPGPALAPYLAGLLVMLGMLGTFLGMVVTFQGAVLALQASGDLQAIRDALAAPIRGLGLSFGTSVAGVAASALLGLLTALARRERLAALRQLDAQVATTLRPFSLGHQRQTTYQALQTQAHVLPELVERMQTLADGLERRSQQLSAQLLDQQQAFHDRMGSAYTDLAQGVGRALQDSLAAGATAAGDSLRPVVQAAMTEIAQESSRQHQRQVDATRAQWDALTARFQASTDALLTGVEQRAAQAQSAQAQTEQQRLTAWQQALDALGRDLQHTWQSLGDQQLAQQQAVCQTLEHTAQQVTGQVQQQARQTLERLSTLLDRSDALVQARSDAEAAWLRTHGQRLDQLVATWRAELATLRADEAARGDAALARLGELQSAMATHLATLGAALEAPLSRLLHTVSEVPQAAADVMAQLRQESTRLTERDHQVVQERVALVGQLQALLDTVQRSNAEQQAAIAALVATAGSTLAQAGAGWTQTLRDQARQSADAATQTQASALELASLGAAFQHGVQGFQASSDRLLDGLQRIEAALQHALTRSDEQLAYCVAQAREVIDLSIGAQQGILADLHRLRQAPAALAEGAAG